MRDWAEWLYHHRRAVAIAIFSATVFFAWQIRHLDISTRFSDLTPRNHPYAELFEKYPGFGSPLTLSLVIQNKSATLYNPQTLRKIQEATRLADLIPGVDHDQILSIASPKVKHVEATIGGIRVSNLLTGPIPQTAGDLAQLRDKIRSTEGVIGTLVSIREDAALIQATFIERLTDFNVIFHAVNEIIEKLRDENHELYAAGPPMLTGWIYHYQGEMYLIFAFGLLAMGLFLVFHFRNISGVVAPLAVGATSAIWGFGFAGTLGYNLDPLIVVVPVLLVARALSHSVQMCERYFEIYREKQDKKKAAVDSLIYLSAPGVMGILCDAAGVLVIAVAPIRLIEKLAYVCGVWSLTLIITAIAGTFVLLTYLPAPKKVQTVIVHSERKKGWLYRIFVFIVFFSSTRGRAAGTCCFFLAVTALAGWWAMQRSVGDVHDGTPLLWPASPYNRAVERINERFAGFDTLHVVAESATPQGIRNRATLDLMQRFQRYMERDREVGGTFSFADLVPQANRLFHGGLPKWGVIPDSDADAALLIHLAMTGASPGDFDHMLARDLSAANIRVWYKDHRGETVARAIHRAQEFVKRETARGPEMPKLRLASGTLGLLWALNETIRRLEVLTVVLISLVIFSVTTWIYRSLTAGLLLTVISNMANLMTAAVMYQLAIGLDVNTLPIGAVGMGIGIDYNIYLMSRMSEEYRVNPDYATLIPASIFTTGKAIFFTATTMVGGIIIWYFMSNLRFQAEMGLLLSTVMMAHVLLALFFQAGFMMLVQPRFIQRGTLMGH